MSEGAGARRPWVRWGDQAKISMLAGGAPVEADQFVDVKLKRPMVVRVRLAAAQLAGAGNCTGCSVLVTVVIGVGSTSLKRIMVLAPTNTTPMETFLDSPAETVFCTAQVIAGASVPPYTIGVTALVSPWFDGPQ